MAAGGGVIVDADGNSLTQLDKDDIESIGLVKFDFLGLRTLTIIDWARLMIDKQRAKKGEPDPAPRCKRRLVLKLLPLSRTSNSTRWWSAGAALDSPRGSGLSGGVSLGPQFPRVTSFGVPLSAPAIEPGPIRACIRAA